MLKLAADENSRASILAGLRRREQDLDIVRIQDHGLSGADDETVLAWAAGEGRVLVTHDQRTMFGPAELRVDQGLAMPGVIIVPWGAPTGSSIEALLLIAVLADAREVAGQVKFLSEFR